MNLECHECNPRLPPDRKCPFKNHIFTTEDGEILNKCPAKLITPMTRQYVKWYHYFKKGMLPFSGSVGRQPARLLHAFEVLDEELSKDPVKRALGEK